MKVREVLPSLPSRQPALQPTQWSHYYGPPHGVPELEPTEVHSKYTPPTSRPTTQPNQPTPQLYPTCTGCPPQWAGRLAATDCTHILRKRVRCR